VCCIKVISFVANANDNINNPKRHNKSRVQCFTWLQYVKIPTYDDSYKYSSSRSINLNTLHMSVDVRDTVHTELL
jgi:hypothetical protein